MYLNIAQNLKLRLRKRHLGMTLQWRKVIREQKFVPKKNE